VLQPSHLSNEQFAAGATAVVPEGWLGAFTLHGRSRLRWIALNGKKSTEPQHTVTLEGIHCNSAN
jgi:hypothetical protein